MRACICTHTAFEDLLEDESAEPTGKLTKAAVAAKMASTKLRHKKALEKVPYSPRSSVYVLVLE
jgi:hypothetical protein